MGVCFPAHMAHRTHTFPRLRPSCSLVLVLAVLLCAKASADSSQVPLRARHVATWGLPALWHLERIQAVSLSPDGQHAFVATQHGLFVQWALARRAQETRFDHDYDFILAAAALSPQGRLALGRGPDGGGSVEVYEPVDGKLLHSLDGPSAPLRALAFSADGSRLAAAADGGPVLLWDLSRKGRARKLFGPKGRTLAVALSADGSRVAAAGEDGVLRVWDTRGGRLLRTLRGGSRAILAVALSADGRFALAGGADGTARLWDVRSGRRVWSQEDDSELTAVALSADGSRAVLAGASVRLWDVPRGQVLAEMTGGPVGSVALLADGSLVAAGHGGQLRLLNAQSGQELWQDHQGHTRAITSLAVTAEGGLVASGSDDASVRLWDPARGISTRVLSGHEGPVVDVAFSQDGKVLLSAGRDGTLRTWDASTGQPGRVLTKLPGEATALATSPAGPLAVLASDDGLLRLWNLLEGKELRTFGAPHRVGYAPVVFSSNGQRILAAREDRIDVYEVPGGELPRTWGLADSSITSLAMSGETVVAGTRDGSLHFWRADTGEALARLSRPTSPVQAVALAPGARLGISAGRDHTLRLWDIEREGELDRLNFHASGDRPTAMVFEPDGRSFLVGTERGLLLRLVLESP
jgi:WD40 repeat protein